MGGMPLVGNEPGTALSAFNPKDIERIEVLKNGGTAGMYGVRGGSGVIAFYTRNSGSSPAKALLKITQPLNLIGYPSRQPNFPVPDYGVDALPTAPNAPLDRRDVLHWKPLVQTGGQGQVSVRFPLSDVVRTIRVTVEGITDTGRAVSVPQLIDVQKVSRNRPGGYPALIMAMVSRLTQTTRSCSSVMRMSQTCVLRPT